MRAPIVTLFLAAGCLLAACGSGGGGDTLQVARVPAPDAPRDVIAFGATEGSGASALYLVDADGTDLRTLSEETLSVSFPRWSPDGDRIAYISGGGRGPGKEATLRIYRFDGATATTISEHVLASGEDAPMSWSPDGTRIAFIDATDGGTLRIYDLQSERLQDKPSVPATAVVWSTKDRLAIVAPAEDDPATTDVYSLSPDDNEARGLATHDGSEVAPAWSYDGNTLTFSSGPPADASQRTLFILPPGSRAPKGIGPGVDATWSKQGRIAYSRPSAAGERGELDIYIADGLSEPKRLTQSITLDRWPSWSPAGDAVVYEAQADASTAFLCVVAPGAADNACFDLPGLTPSDPAWSPY